MIRTAALAAALVWCTIVPVSAATPNEFYGSLLRRGVAAYDAGRYDEAARQLRIAAFGLIETIESYQTAQVYLTLASDKLGNEDRASDAARRVLAAERVERRYASLSLPAAVRTAFERIATRVLSAAEVAGLRGTGPLPAGAAPHAPRVTNTTPAQTQPPVTVSRVEVETVKPPATTTNGNPVPARSTTTTNPPATTTTTATNDNPLPPRSTATNPSTTNPPATIPSAPSTTTTNNPPRPATTNPPAATTTTTNNNPVPPRTTTTNPSTTNPPATNPSSTNPNATATTTTNNPPRATTTNPPASTTTTTTTTPPRTTTTQHPATTSNPQPARPTTTTPVTTNTPVNPSPTRPPAPVTFSASELATRFAAAERALIASNLIEARRIYREILESANLSHDNALRLAEGFYRARDFANALRAFDRAGTLRRGEEPYRYYIAVALYESSRYTEAKRELAAALPYIEITPDVARYRAKIESAIAQ